MGTDNISDLDFDSLSDRIYRAVRPDGSQIYADDQIIDIRFRPDGTLAEFLVSFYASKTVMGRQQCLRYQTGLENRKLVIHVMSRGDWETYSKWPPCEPVELKSCLKGLDEMNLPSLRDSGEENGAAYTAVFRMQFEKGGQPLDAAADCLFLSGGGSTKAAENQKLERDAVVYTIASVKNQEEHALGSVCREVSYLRGKQEENPPLA